jgi:hypothetical protein
LVSFLSKLLALKQVNSAFTHDLTAKLVLQPGLDAADWRHLTHLSVVPGRSRGTVGGQADTVGDEAQVLVGER